MFCDGRLIESTNQDQLFAACCCSFGRDDGVLWGSNRDLRLWSGSGSDGFLISIPCLIDGWLISMVVHVNGLENKSYVIDSVDLFAERAQPFASLYSNLIERLGNFLKVRALAFKTSSHSPYGAHLSSCKFVLRRAALCVTCGFVGTCPMYWLYLMVRRELRLGIHIFQFSTRELITCCLFLFSHCYVPCT